jgi:thiamine pyrophosphokinase
MHVLIFANGIHTILPNQQMLIDAADLVIAADGGGNHCHQLGIRPNILLGDLDSISRQALDYITSGTTEINRYPRKKNATDLELSLDLAMERGATHISLLGALGGRWDMSLANILLAASAAYKNIRISLLNNECEMVILHPDREHILTGSPGDTVSFMPLQGDVTGVTLAGFDYPLHDHTLRFGSSLGVSNVLQTAVATIFHTEGVLLCVRQL